MGREFVDLFETWADTYDESVNGQDAEYREVFENYHTILDEVSQRIAGPVAEFGVGTGNLTERLLERGHLVYGVEPSVKMRMKVLQRFPDLYVVDGDFVDFPSLPGPIQSIASTYAFHHLTDEEKQISLLRFNEMLPDGGKVVFADTAFASMEERSRIVEDAQRNGFVHLLEDLNREYYPMLDHLHSMFTRAGFQVSWQQKNRFVWILEATKVSTGA